MGQEITGITPAGAGKTIQPTCVILPFEDHPRRCGENRSYPFDAPVLAGSPPQVRGKPIAKQLRHRRVGITPAGAGKTHQVLSLVLAQRDHPRRCGENFRTPKMYCNCSGSPPQVRGKPLEIVLYLAHAGITPAGAGKTVLKLINYHTQKDHPRRCGENSLYRFLSELYLGSPPQVRGKLIVRL